MVLHSVPPVLVLLATEVAPALRDRLTEAVTAAARAATAPARPASVDGTAAASPHPEPLELGLDDEAEQVFAPQRGPAAGPRFDDVGDARVRLLVELLDDDAEVTRAQALVLLAHTGHGEFSDRTGRRLLAAARDYLGLGDEPDPPGQSWELGGGSPVPTARIEPDPLRPRLHLLPLPSTTTTAATATATAATTAPTAPMCTTTATELGD